MTTHHPIAIVGAGLGGLTAARVLHTRGIEAAVFELEPDRDSRVQGGMLDIHQENGQRAVHAAGLDEQFRTIVHPGGEAMRILDHRATVLREEPDDGRMSRPEVDRGQLRDLMLDSVPTGTVRWGHRVDTVRPVPGAPGRHEVSFAGGDTVTTDLLIGADGAWSKVRALLSDAQPAYTGVSFLEADLLDADDRHPAQAAAMGGGMLFAFRGTTGILGHRETDGSLHVYLGTRVAQDWADTVDWSDPGSARQAGLDLLAGWDASLRGLLGDADGALVPRRINALPADHEWRRVPGVTLLGDAAHLMSPFAGEGANLAMYDGAQLALAVADNLGDVDAGLAAYEAELFPRSTDAARQSADSLQMLFRDDSPAGLVEMFAGFDRQQALA